MPLLQITVLIQLLLLTHLIDAVDVTCDIVIGGGNTGALSAAISIAEAATKANKQIKVCLLEPTDWYGGQMTAQGVSAIDYGDHNRYEGNWPDSWKALMDVVAPGNKNQGVCWVSTTCYQPQILMDQFVIPVLNKYSDYITVYDRTVIIDAVNGKDSIESVTAVQRKPVDPTKEWSYLLSQQLEDWYSTNDSKLFTKTEYTLKAKVFIEATELGDIMMNVDGLTIFQGAETPYENSTTTVDQCGQAVTFTFFMELLSSIPENPPYVPPGNPEGTPYGYQGHEWLQVWTYRRSMDADGVNSPQNQLNIGDITQQNWGEGNDFDTGYVFLPVAKAKQNGVWKGGINMTALSEAEQRAYGFYHYYINTSYLYNGTTKFDPRQLIMQVNISNTTIGLSKYPYMRDVKRSYGLFDFRLNHTTMLNIYNETSESGYAIGYKFPDRVAIGNYPFDMHIQTNQYCKQEYPDYVKSGQSGNVPYFIPFRALGSNVYKNLLFAGKNIAQSFYANAATRLHPSEWTTGIAAGGAAYFMVDNDINDTEIVYNQIDKLQQLLISIGQKIEWD